VISDESALEPLGYRQRDADGQVQQFEIAYAHSPGIDFYILSVRALDASDQSFVYDNPFYDHSADEVNFYMEDLNVHIDWMQNVPDGAGLSNLKIRWFGLPFYGRYRRIFYAADQNFKEFFLTHSTVQDIDGNFHEPIMHIEGDGAGIFGSAIVDTVYFEVNR
jgi:hypothetical protein